MTTVSKWSNVGVALQSSLATAITITGITKANPGVVTYTGTDPTNGDFILLDTLGQWQVDDRIFRVANENAGANTLELEGEDTTLYDTFTSGTGKVITFGTTINTLTGLTANGGEFSFLDITTIHDNIKKSIPGIANEINYQFESLWDPADAGLKALKLASDNQSQLAVRFTFASGARVLFLGYVGCTLIPGGTALEIVKTAVSISCFGRPTVYAT